MNRIRKFVIAHYSELDGLDQVECEATNEFTALQFVLMCKKYNIDDCTTIEDLLNLVSEAGAFIDIK